MNTGIKMKKELSVKAPSTFDLFLHKEYIKAKDEILRNKIMAKSVEIRKNGFKLTCEIF